MYLTTGEKISALKRCSKITVRKCLPPTGQADLDNQCLDKWISTVIPCYLVDSC